ncbi:hypothetical protein ACN28E_54490 [Archangium lansingense]|uniref:hypothetical protein n=1 Tax=Archangium lansingense TaxID=2995310 RepID=UPI003B7EE826
MNHLSQRPRLLPWLLLSLLASGSAAAGEAVEAPVPPGYSERLVIPAVRLGLWQAQGASRRYSSHPSPGLRALHYLSPSWLMDAGYQFAIVEPGNHRFEGMATLHALDARIHWVLPVGGSSLTFGAGPTGYLSTGTELTEPALRGGFGGAVGLQTDVQPVLVRFEASVQSRGNRLDSLFSVTLGWL